ncbi:hypothetical protein ABK040_013430 [Willaertia magna]
MLRSAFVGKLKQSSTKRSVLSNKPVKSLLTSTTPTKRLYHTSTCTNPDSLHKEHRSFTTNLKVSPVVNNVTVLPEVVANLETSASLIIKKITKKLFVLLFKFIFALVFSTVLLISFLKASIYSFYLFQLDDPLNQFYSEQLDHFVQYLEGTDRFIKTISAITVIAIDYFLLLSDSSFNPYYWFNEKVDRNSEEFLQLKKLAHLRNAERLKVLFSEHKGIYIKYGQFFANLSGWIPKEYVQVLSPMKDQAPRVSYEEVRKVIFQDFGKPVEELFKEFDPTPIASASVAQVHRAVTLDGQVVAVKVQYPYVQRFFHSDMNTNELANKLSIKLYHLQENAENIDALIELNNRFNDEMKRGFFTELDFHHEANNAKTAAKNLSNRKDIYIPKIYDDLTSTRVLTMEFIEGGVKSNNIKAIQELGFDVSDIATRIFTASAQQVFLNGHFHADLHSSNVFVRPHPSDSTKPQIVFLDHGLYLQLSDEFRTNYAKYWMSIILGDEEEMKAYCKRLGILDHRLYQSIVMFQAYDQFGKIDASVEKPLTEKDWEDFFKAMQIQKDAFLNIYRNMPEAMVFILRCDNILRSLNNDLGANVNRFSIMARMAAKGVATTKQKATTLYSRFMAFNSQINFECRLMWISLKTWVLTQFIKVFGYERFIKKQEKTVKIEQDVDIMTSSQHYAANYN